MAKTPDNRPWAPHPIPNWIIKEFTRRQNDIGFEYPINVTWDDNGSWQNYKGPLTAWVRVFSNGVGRSMKKVIIQKKVDLFYKGDMDLIKFMAYLIIKMYWDMMLKVMNIHWIYQMMVI